MRHTKPNIKLMRPQSYYIQNKYYRLIGTSRRFDYEYGDAFNNETLYKISIYSNVWHYIQIPTAIRKTIQQNSKVGYLLLTKKNNTVAIGMCSRVNAITRYFLLHACDREKTLKTLTNELSLISMPR